MAQVCGGTTFDFAWREQFEAGLRCLRAAADRWAAGGSDALPTEAVLAALVQTLNGGGYDLHPLEDRLPAVGPLADECRRVRPLLAPDEAADVTVALIAVAIDAVTRWSAGNPEDPPVDAVLCRLVGTLFRHRLVRRPPPKR